LKFLFDDLSHVFLLTRFFFPFNFLSFSFFFFKKKILVDPTELQKLRDLFVNKLTKGKQELDMGTFKDLYPIFDPIITQGIFNALGSHGATSLTFEDFSWGMSTMTRGSLIERIKSKQNSI
jgi:hypothetical protein